MSVVDEIKARLDIVDVVSRYVSLKKGGRNYKALCPFHAERTPSFVVFPDRQTWRCFGACNEGGDIFSFVMKAEGWDFREALQVLAERAGVELKPQTPEARAQQETADRLLQLLAVAEQLYTNQLLNEASEVRAYVEQGRGLTEETIQQFGLGYAPNRWDFALNQLRGRGYSVDEIIAAGMAIRNDRGRVYDRFRQRLMIPIRDSRGRVLGFGARALEADQQPKYLNSPQGELFDKSRLLYGLDQARRSIREQEIAVITEGYMDVMQAHQAGYTNVVAQMGTALTEAQVRQVAKYATRLVLALDTDVAGVQATMRGLEVVRESLSEAGSQKQAVFDARNMMYTAGKLSLDVRVLQLPAGKDPDEFIRANAEQWSSLVENAQPLVDYVISMGTRDLSPQASIQEREKAARQLLPLLTATENDLYRHQNIQLLAHRVRIPPQDLLNWVGLQKGKGATRVPKARPGNVRRYNGTKAIPISLKGVANERYVLSLLLRQPDWLFSANRKLRELGTERTEATRLLQGVNEQDFSRQDHRVLFQLIEAASFEGVDSSIIFISQKAPEIVELVEDIYQVGQLEAIRRTLPPSLDVEIPSIIQEIMRFGGEIEFTLEDFLFATLNLRLDRLRREMNDRHFLNLDDGVDDDHLETYMYHRAIELLTKAAQAFTHRR